jgi:ribosomal protein S27AE
MVTVLKDAPGMSELKLKTHTRQANWRRQNPEKYLAHVAVQRALNAGVLAKGKCDICGDATVDAHHDDYATPLKVRWLCRRHHIRLHATGCEHDLFPVWTGARPS